VPVRKEQYLTETRLQALTLSVKKGGDNDNRLLNVGERAHQKTGEDQHESKGGRERTLCIVVERRRGPVDVRGGSSVLIRRGKSSLDERFENRRGESGPLGVGGLPTLYSKKGQNVLGKLPFEGGSGLAPGEGK